MKRGRSSWPRKMPHPAGDDMRASAGLRIKKKPRNAGLVSYVVVVDLGNRCQPTRSTTRTQKHCGWNVGGLSTSG
jgi:hypothetical protein